MMKVDAKKFAARIAIREAKKRFKDELRWTKAVNKEIAAWQEVRDHYANLIAMGAVESVIMGSEYELTGDEVAPLKWAIGWAFADWAASWLMREDYEVCYNNLLPSNWVNLF